jgi:hypothetical protein
MANGQGAVMKVGRGVVLKNINIKHSEEQSQGKAIPL